MYNTIVFNRSGLSYLTVKGGVVMASVLSFKSAFENTVKVTSKVPKLWERHQSAIGTDCFTGAENAENFRIIPLGWGGLVETVNANIDIGTIIEGVLQLPTVPTLIVDPEII